jgi:hypothetical protein
MQNYKTDEIIYLEYKGKIKHNTKWIILRDEIKWLKELQARIELNYPKNEIIEGINNHIKKLKGEK